MQIVQQSSVEFTTSQGVELEARLVRLGRFDAVFELFGPDEVLRASELLTPLKIVHGGHLAYEGRATVASLVSIPGGVTAEARLDDPGAHLPEMALTGGALYDDFQRHWLAGYQIRQGV